MTWDVESSDSIANPLVWSTLRIERGIEGHRAFLSQGLAIVI